MLKQFYVKYWTTDHQVVGITISAMNASCAIEYVENMPNYDGLAGYPEEV